MGISNILSNWEFATQELADAFVKKYYGEDLSECRWIGNEAGDILEINGQFWDVNDMVDALRYKCSKKRLFEWYDLCVDVDSKARRINLKNYAKYGSITK
jgi:hypothetical protein